MPRLDKRLCGDLTYRQKSSTPARGRAAVLGRYALGKPGDCNAARHSPSGEWRGQCQGQYVCAALTGSTCRADLSVSSRPVAGISRLPVRRFPSSSAQRRFVEEVALGRNRIPRSILAVLYARAKPMALCLRRAAHIAPTFVRAGRNRIEHGVGTATPTRVG
jgi:hypothetical protein